MAPLDGLSLKGLADSLKMSTPADGDQSPRSPPPMSAVSRKSSVSSRRGSINPGSLRRMSERNVTLPAVGDAIKMIFFGAGNIAFGSAEGNWNHSERVERKFGIRLKVLAIVDPWTERVESVLKTKREGFVRSAYAATQHFRNIDECVAGLAGEQPTFILVGTPAFVRGSTQPGADLEMRLLKFYPGVPLFIEKPVGAGSVEEAKKVGDILDNSNTIVSVGYMLRYLKAVQVMKQIIAENNLTVVATVARYIAAYEAIAKLNWWDKSKDGGPVVEQGTHFADLSRYFGGDFIPETVVGNQVEWYTPAGKLKNIPIDEQLVAEDQRIPRFTSASWQYENGASGTLIHGAVLGGTAYNTELIVYADGYQMRLVDPYGAVKLYIRRPGDDHEECHHFHNDDPFFNEISAFGDEIMAANDSAVHEEGEAEILSSFSDAAKSYELTWAIREACERNSIRRPVPEKSS